MLSGQGMDPALAAAYGKATFDPYASIKGGQPIVRCSTRYSELKVTVLQALLDLFY